MKTMNKVTVRLKWSYEVNRIRSTLSVVVAKLSAWALGSNDRLRVGTRAAGLNCLIPLFRFWLIVPPNDVVR